MAELLYQGHGSLRMKTGNGKVIYIDPYAGEGYDVPADLILVTHQHYDHNCIEKPVKNDGCVIYQNMDALHDGVYGTLRLDDITVEAVQAYNHHHKKEECVGYIVSTDGISIYFAGDTGETEDMQKMKERHLDYAVLPMDSTYTMDVEETMHCAEIIGARHTIPVHMKPGGLYDEERARLFTVPGALLVKPGETITL